MRRLAQALGLALGLGLVVGALLLFWVFRVEPELWDTRTYTLEDADLAGLTVVFLSDLHPASHQRERLQRIVQHANALQPDIILLGGDYIKGRSDTTSLPIETVVEELGKLQAPLGVYAVMGNHDLWYSKQRVLAAFEKNGIPVLDNSHIVLDEGKIPFTLAGVDDLWDGKPDLEKTLAGVQGPVILLSHNPELFPSVPGSVNLTLSGHTHGGQVQFPYTGVVLTPVKQKYSFGLFEENGNTIIVSTGIGTSVLPVRFMCVPEVVRIRFVPEA